MSLAEFPLADEPLASEAAVGCVPETPQGAILSASSDGFYWGKYPAGDAPGCDAFSFTDITGLDASIDEIISDVITITNPGEATIKAWSKGVGEWSKQIGGVGDYVPFTDEPWDVAAGDNVVLRLDPIVGTIVLEFNAGTQSASWSVTAS